MKDEQRSPEGAWMEITDKQDAGLEMIADRTNRRIDTARSDK